ncbi:MAG: DUF368 domain-containing protein [Caldilineaceae bacterium]
MRCSPVLKRTARDYGVLGLKGFAMGSADVVPGVSGGTMAFILGIYEELINSIKMIGPELWRAVLGLRIGQAVRILNVPFCSRSSPHLPGHFHPGARHRVDVGAPANLHLELLLWPGPGVGLQ